jgi:tripartite-type tricarboxylate transporter receptor subunit TctC
MKTIIAAAALAAMFAMPGGALAQGGQPLRIIVPFAAGGTVDVTARAIAPIMGQVLNQTVVVENRPGAGGMLGAREVMSAKPDGLTLMMGSSSTLTVGPNLYPNWPYDPVTGITPISNVQVVPFALVVKADSPFKSVADVLKAAKEKPGAVTQAHAGIGSSNHLVSELFQMLTAEKFLLVPYRGGGPAMNDLIAGQVATYFDQASTTVPQIQGGQIRALAVTAKTRMSTLPDVPTFAEQGVKDFEVLNITGLAGPPGMDKAVVEKLRNAVVKAVENAQVKEHFARLGVQIIGDTPAEFAAFLREDLARWKRVVTEANVQVP